MNYAPAPDPRNPDVAYTPELMAYRAGYRAGMQRALDLTCKAVDFASSQPSHPMAERVNLLTNLISMIQSEPEPREY